MIPCLGCRNKNITACLVSTTEINLFMVHGPGKSRMELWQLCFSWGLSSWHRDGYFLTGYSCGLSSVSVCLGDGGVGMKLSILIALLINTLISSDQSSTLWPYLALLFSKAEKAMAPHSGTLALKIPWTEEPGRLQSMGLLRVGHDWATLLSLFTLMHWRRKWQPTPVFLPGESQGRRSLVGCSLWGRTESDTTEVT